MKLSFSNSYFDIFPYVFLNIFVASVLDCSGLGPSQALAATQGTELAVKFYKNPQSIFASGEMSRRDLEKYLNRDFVEANYLVKRGQQIFWVNASTVAKDIHLSEIANSASLKQQVRLLQVNGSEALVSAPNFSTPLPLPLKDLSPIPTDLGIGLTLIPTQLREFPSWKSDSLISLPSGSRLQIIKFDDNWALVNFESVGKISGWVDLSNLLVKYDFASFIQKKGRSDWIPCAYREGSEIITKDKERIPLEKISSVMTKPDLAISLVSNDTEGLRFKQNLQILDQDAEAWSVSQIPGFGDVYWRKSSTKIPSTSETQPTLSNEDLLKREISSASFHPKDKNIGVVSAQGIFITEDGKSWKQISRFKNTDHPVLFDSEGNLFVGSLRSIDLGKSFHPYFRWEPLAQLLENRQKSPANQLKIKNLSNPKPGIFRMEVETQKGRIYLAAKLNAGFISKWDFD